MSDQDARRLYSIDESRRASHDADELEKRLGRALRDSFTAQAVRVLAEQLVTEAWTRIGPGEQVVCRPTPRNRELSLCDQLEAAIAGTSYSMSDDPVALAEYLVGDGWLKPGADEHVISTLDAKLLIQAKAAFQTWETLKSESRKRLEPPVRCPVCNEGYDSLVTVPGKKVQFVHHISLDGKDFETHEFWWPQAPAVSADSSELTATVKLQPESLILAAFIGADRPLTRAEACDAAAGHRLDVNDTDWDLWFNAFGSLVLKDWVREQHTRLGEERLYVLTEAGRGLHELDGIDP